MRRLLYTLLASGLAAGAVLLLLWLRSDEPVYEGKALSDWIVAMHGRKAPERAHARAIVHHLGTNSIPLLLKWMQQPDHPSFRGRLLRAKAGVTGWLERRKLLPSRPGGMAMDWKQSYRFLAIEAFSELGPDGKAAIPGLIRLLAVRDGSTNEVSDTAGFAYVVLQQMTPTSIPALIEALSSPDDQVWDLAAEALAEAGPQAKPAIPILRRRLADRDPLIRLEAADAMGKLGADPEEFMPTVVDTLREPDVNGLDEKLAVLLQYKEHAQAAVPVLRNLLAQPGNSTNQTIRYMLTNALAQLCPDPATGQRSR